MSETSTIFLLANVALAFYNTGTIWAIEVDIFRSWQMLDKISFAVVRRAHWKKLPYWIFIPVELAFIGAIILIGYHPAGSPSWAIWVNLFSQLCSHLLTAAFRGPWRIRTLLINIYAINLLAWMVIVIPMKLIR